MGCPYCGENPTSHTSHWLFESMDILTQPVKESIFYGPLGKPFDWLAESILLIFYYGLKGLGLIQHNNNPKTIPFNRGRVLTEEAITRNIKFLEIKPFGKSLDIYRFTNRGKVEFFQGLPRPKGNWKNISWIDDKYRLKQALIKNNLPCANGGTFTNLQKALECFHTLKKPVIIKPRLGSRGRHTTTFITNEKDFIKAFRIAKQLCHWVIVEEHLFGSIYRGTVVGNSLVGVLGGSPPQIIGDGKNNIKKLILEKNQTRHEKQGQINITEHLENFLKRSNMTLDTIIKAGQTIDLSEKIGVRYGGTSFDATNETHPDTKLMLTQAAKAVNVPILGFDFIIPDITKSYKNQRCGIIECNGAPFINLHHDVMIGQPINAAKYVWDLVLKQET
jgi:D-alanine-D-alanine ligase-like ATP-grasp enzyme